MESPWMANDQGAYQIPGYAQLLLARNEANDQAVKNIGRFVGAVGAGAIGAGQGAQNPGAFGQGTSPAGGALQAGLMDFSNAYRNGGGIPSALQTGSPTGSTGENMSAFSRLTNPGAASSAGMNFKQFAAQGKMADATRSMMKEQTPTLPGQDTPVMGYTDDQWKHLGTADKISAFAAVKQANDMQVASQTAKEIGARIQYYNALGSFRQSEAEQDAGMGALLNNLPAKGSNPDGSYSMTDFVNAARGAKLNPKVQGAVLGKFLTPQTQFQFNPKTDVTPMGGGLQFVRTSKGGGMVTPAPGSGPATVMVDDGAGNQIPVLVNPKTGGATQIKTGTLTQDDRLRSIDTQLKAIRSLPAQMRSPEDANDLAQLLEARTALMNGGAGGPAAAPKEGAPGVGPLQIPLSAGKPDPTKMKAGETYQTQYGPAVWDGKRFTRAAQ